MPTYDEMAIDILLSNKSAKAKQKRLQKLAKHAAGERECPECGKVDVHEDNGQTGVHLSWLCTCGHQWDEHES